MRILLIFAFVFLSCNNRENFENSTSEVDTLKLNSFDYKYKNEPKYFLKFWNNMTKEDYYQAKKLMKKEGLIDFSHDEYGNLYDIKIGDDIINFTPVLEKNLIIGVSISDVNENIYNLFMKKYNLPKLVNESTIGVCYKESNPCFLKNDCNDFLNIGNDISIVSLNEVKKQTNLNEELEEYNTKVLPEDYIEIKNEKSNIILRNNLSLRGISLIGKLKTVKHDLNTSSFYYPNNNELFESLNYRKDKKSQIRYVVTKNKNSIEITYYPNDYFTKEKKKKNTETLKENNLKNETLKKQEKFIEQI
jgi:hypothetical protein